MVVFFLCHEQLLEYFFCYLQLDPYEHEDISLRQTWYKEASDEMEWFFLRSPISNKFLTSQGRGPNDIFVAGTLMKKFFPI